MLASEIREKLIIAADDFAISGKSNRNILELLQLGKIDRVAVMIDGWKLPTREEVGALLSSGAAIDIHLNAIEKITERRRLSAPVFSRLLDFAWRLVKGDVRTRAMERKWRKELETFRKIFGRDPDGISAHQHIHFFPPYFRSVVGLAEEFGIGYIRFGRKGMVGKFPNNVYRILYQLHRKDQLAYDRSGLDSSDYWCSLDWIDDLDRFLDALPDGRTELVVHPERDNEFETLKNRF